MMISLRVRWLGFLLGSCFLLSACTAHRGFKPVMNVYQAKSAGVYQFPQSNRVAGEEQLLLVKAGYEFTVYATMPNSTPATNLLQIVLEFQKTPINGYLNANQLAWLYNGSYTAPSNIYLVLTDLPYKNQISRTPIARSEWGHLNLQPVPYRYVIEYSMPTLVHQFYYYLNGLYIHDQMVSLPAILFLYNTTDRVDIDGVMAKLPFSAMLAPSH